MADRRPIVLVGMMGSGKSTVAAALAARLGVAAVDVDAAVEHLAGCTISQLFATGGEAEFRRLEAETLGRLLDEGHRVIATGGGIVTEPAVRRRLRDETLTVWLRARPATLVSRVGDAAGRPMLTESPDGVLGALERLDRQRREWYEEVAGVVVDVDDRDVREVVEAVLVETGLSQGGAS